MFHALYNDGEPLPNTDGEIVALAFQNPPFEIQREGIMGIILQAYELNPQGESAVFGGLEPAPPCPYPRLFDSPPSSPDDSELGRVFTLLRDDVFRMSAIWKKRLRAIGLSVADLVQEVFASILADYYCDHGAIIDELDATTDKELKAYVDRVANRLIRANVEADYAPKRSPLPQAAADRADNHHRDREAVEDLFPDWVDRRRTNWDSNRGPDAKLSRQRYKQLRDQDTQAALAIVAKVKSVSVTPDKIVVNY